MILACLHRTVKTPLEKGTPISKHLLSTHTLCINALHPYNSLIRLILLPSSSWQNLDLNPALWNVCSVTQLCPTLCDPLDCSLPGPSVRVIFQARILEQLPLTSLGDLDTGIEP